MDVVLLEVLLLLSLCHQSCKYCPSCPFLPSFQDTSCGYLVIICFELGSDYVN